MCGSTPVWGTRARLHGGLWALNLARNFQMGTDLIGFAPAGLRWGGSVRSSFLFHIVPDFPWIQMLLHLLAASCRIISANLQYGFASSGWIYERLMKLAGSFLGRALCRCQARAGRAPSSPNMFSYSIIQASERRVSRFHFQPPLSDIIRLQYFVWFTLNAKQRSKIRCKACLFGFCFLGCFFHTTTVLVVMDRNPQASYPVLPNQHPFCFL